MELPRSPESHEQTGESLEVPAKIGGGLKVSDVWFPGNGILEICKPAMKA